MKPKIIILHATGTNRDRDVAWACELAGGIPEIVHINQLINGEHRLLDFQMLVLPGGFSNGDDLGAGKLWAVTLRYRLAEALAQFVAARRPILGICNGFQALVKSGLLPGDRHPPEVPATSRVWSRSEPTTPTMTLTRNDSAQFECRWVYLQPQPDSPCIFTHGLTEPIYCPVAHGEGKFVTQDAATLVELEARGGVALRYIDSEGQPADYPWNPNGSIANIAGICNPAGTIFGLMPHPEDHLILPHHPHFHRGKQGMLGLPLFRNGLKYAAGL